MVILYSFGVPSDNYTHSNLGCLPAASASVFD